MKLSAPITIAVATAMLIASAPLGRAGESTTETTCERRCHGSNGCTTTCTTKYTPPPQPVRNGRLDGLLNDRSGGGVAIWNTR